MPPHLLLLIIPKNSTDPEHVLIQQVNALQASNKDLSAQVELLTGVISRMDIQEFTIRQHIVTVERQRDNYRKENDGLLCERAELRLRLAHLEFENNTSMTKSAQVIHYSIYVHP